jgi:protocatechuate 3,4-dioxygenase beta subunit
MCPVRSVTYRQSKPSRKLMDPDPKCSPHRRRALFTLLGTGVTALWVGPSNGQVARAGREGAALMCVATPEQTEGPYFVEGHLNRSDIRSDPADGSVRPGLPLSLQIHVSRVDSAGCLPLVGATVDIWHCDAQGVYSGVGERRSRTPGSRFLRGYQVTDAGGSVRFVTIYPGWYPGRAVHIHLKIRTGSDAVQALQWTSQLYFDETITDQAHRQVAYAQREGHRTRNGADDIFQDGGRSLMLALSGATEGYDARFNVGLRLPSQGRTSGESAKANMDKMWK